jgi:hypothetical protein
MDVATPWFRIIWVFVALGECLGIVPAAEDRYLPAVYSDRGIQAPIVLRIPQAAALPVIATPPGMVSIDVAGGTVTLTHTLADGTVRETEIPPRAFPGCAASPCAACPDGTTPVLNLPLIQATLQKLKAHPSLVAVREVTIVASEDVLYRDIVQVLELARAAREIPGDATPCTLLAGAAGDALFPNAVFAVGR